MKGFITLTRLQATPNRALLVRASSIDMVEGVAPKTGDRFTTVIAVQGLLIEVSEDPDEVQKRMEKV